MINWDFFWDKGRYRWKKLEDFIERVNINILKFIYLVN